MTLDLAMHRSSDVAACGGDAVACRAAGGVWYWGYWFSAGVPAAGTH